MTALFIWKVLHDVRRIVSARRTERMVSSGLGRPGASLHDFDCDRFRNRVVHFVESMGGDDDTFQYRFSAGCTRPTLYSSAYACMTYALVGVLENLPAETRRRWVEYFDCFQDAGDGLFYDPVVLNDLYKHSDWWGARHLALHMISAYTTLGARPKHPFHFLKAYYREKDVRSWLETRDWSRAFSYADDFDNQLMNIGCLLQYQRDFWGDEKAARTIAFIQNFLHDRINPATGMWGNYELDDPVQRSRMVQFAYHLLPIFLYDDIYEFDHRSIVEIVLRTQNRLGGFGVRVNSSACEDIDSVDILIRFSRFVPELKTSIDEVLTKAFAWILCNQTEDGGFVFRLCEGMKYGHREMRSTANRGEMFSTWFRTLSIAYLLRHYYLGNSSMKVAKSPGLMF